MIRRLLGRFRRDESGVSSVEFALTFPVVFYFFGLGAEVGLYQLQQVMFERGVDIVVRDLRLGDETLRDPDVLISRVCEESFAVPRCHEGLNLEMEPVQVSTYRISNDPLECVNRTEEARPMINMVPGAGDDVMILRFCLLIDPVFANWGLGKVLPRVEGGGVPIYAQTLYVIEP